MPGSKYIKVIIGGQEVDLFSTQDLPIRISYQLEDPQNFQSKQSSQVPSLIIPATTRNDRVANTFHNPDVEDLTPQETYKSFRPALIEANGYELLVGKALLTNAEHMRLPTSYEYDLFGNNGDWIIPLKEATLYDFLKDINFTFTKQLIIDSWAYDGTNPNLPYVFAPVRYGQQMESGTGDLLDYNMIPTYMKPALSVYWLLFNGFKSLGYKIKSDFFDTAYFRRQVMPWTWGNFLFSEGTRLDNLDFRAKSSSAGTSLSQDYNDFFDCHVDNDSTNGAFDNNGVYEYDPVAFEMKWTYLPAFNYGNLNATFLLSNFIDAIVTANSQLDATVFWYKNGVDQGSDLLIDIEAPSIGRETFIGIVDKYKTMQVQPGDIVSAKIFLHAFDSGAGRARIRLNVDAFELEYFTIPLGGTINFEGYNAFKKHKFLDFVAGVLDAFNISPQTDPINKVVTMEPMHPYSLTNDLSERSGGYFNGQFLDWNSKQDLSKKSRVHLFSDSERELLFKFKNDQNDGLLKKVQDRNSNTIGLGKYAFNDRFKAGKKEIENRFFSPVMHAELLQWKGLGDGDASPQIVCLVPENVSNTSKDEAQNTFAPKLCYYKGLVSNVGWVFDGVVTANYPFMFAVNYQTGGQSDPVLSYCDERIGTEGEYVLAKGLLRRYFLQRMAIMRNGQYYTTFFRLTNLDITNWLHREHIVCRNQKWELHTINEFGPLLEESTQCFLKKHVPVSKKDSDNVFPSESTVLDISPPVTGFDIKYNPMKCLSSDIPVITP